MWLKRAIYFLNILTAVLLVRMSTIAIMFGERAFRCYRPEIHNFFLYPTFVLFLTGFVLALRGVKSAWESLVHKNPLMAGFMIILPVFPSAMSFLIDFSSCPYIFLAFAFGMPVLFGCITVSKTLWGERRVEPKIVIPPLCWFGLSGLVTAAGRIAWAISGLCIN